MFTPARYLGLDGMKFPARATDFPTKDDMAEYLQAYADRFDLRVRHGVRIDHLSRGHDGRYLLSAGRQQVEAEHVVVAMSRHQKPRVPEFANELAREIVQIHSLDYRGPGQLADGPVLVVGAGNSGADIALDLAPLHKTFLSGRHPGHVPFRIEGFLGAHLLIYLVLNLAFHRLLTVDSRMGRKLRSTVLEHSGPLIRVKPKDLDAARVTRAARVAGVREGRPVLDDGEVLDVKNVVWCTGFEPGFSWIDLPVFDADGLPRNRRGEVVGEPGLWFVGLPFIYSLSSAMVHGVGRDAEHVAGLIAARIAADG